MAYPSFSAGDVLAASDMNRIGLWLIGSTALTTGSSYTLSSVFSSSFRDYLIVGSFTRTAGSGTAYAFLRLGASSTDHVMSGQYMSWNSGTRTGDNGADGYAFFTGSGANSFATTVLAPNLAQYSYMNTVGNSPDYTTTTAIRVANSTQYTSVQLVVGTGAFSGGYVSVYGYRT